MHRLLRPTLTLALILITTVIYCQRERIPEWDSIGATQHALQITWVNVSDPDMVGGVHAIFDFRFLSKSETIKYLTVTVVPYNAVGDVVSCTITGRSEVNLKITGPIPASYVEHSEQFSNAWYNSTITCARISQVKVEYMSGKSYTYVKELSKIIDYTDFTNSCKYKG